MNAYKRIGAMIKEARISKNITQAELAEQLGFETPQFISLIERGLSKPPLKLIGQVIPILGLNEKLITKMLLDHEENKIKEGLAEGKSA